MNCPSCKATLQPGARFCGICGHRLAQGKGSEFGQDEGATEIDPQQRFLGDSTGDPFVGMVLNDRFIVEDKLGEGGFGAVYRGVQSGTGRKVAIKLLHPDVTQDDNLVARFRREGLVLCNLRDAHTVTTYDFDQTPDGTLYIAMELLEGKSLHDLFYEEAPLAWRRMLKILTEMCSSLAEAHAQGVVHRDLKPENIYLEDRPGHPDFVKILDFGIAKVMRGDTVGGKATQLTATGQTLGTLEYMSPEQLMGKQLDGRSDIYALGVLVYEMITGRLPFPDAKGPAALITAQLRQVPEAPSVANPAGQIPRTVDALVLKMLAKDRDSRFADVNELREASHQLLMEDASGPWRPPAAAAAPGPAQQAPGGARASYPPAGPQPGSSMPQPPGPPRGDGGGPAPRPEMQPPGGQPHAGQGPYAQAPHPHASQSPYAGPSPQAGQHASQSPYAGPSPQAGPSPHPMAGHGTAVPASSGSRLWLWIALGIIALGGAAGAVAALI